MKEKKQEEIIIAIIIGIGVSLLFGLVGLIYFALGYAAVRLIKNAK